MKLIRRDCIYYRVKRGQKLATVARAFGCPPRALAAFNDLSEEIEEGQIIKIPPCRNLYKVRGGESKSLLCGSEEGFEERNGTKCFYPAQQIFL